MTSQNSGVGSRHTEQLTMESTRNALRPIHPFPARMAPSIIQRRLKSHKRLRVVDPMVGSGTTVVTARILGHHAIGFDTDPLALLIAKAWSTMKPGRVRLTMIGVGWGDSIFLESVDSCGNSHYALVDCNDTTYSRSSHIFLKRFFEKRGVVAHPSSILFDWVLLSHAHADHGNGLTRYSKISGHHGCGTQHLQISQHFWRSFSGSLKDRARLRAMSVSTSPNSFLFSVMPEWSCCGLHLAF